MNVALLLTWFPIVLAVGVAGRLLERERGFAFGVLCSLFWIVVVGATAPEFAWSSGWSITAVVGGVGAIISIGGWSAQHASRQQSLRKSSAPQPNRGPNEPDLELTQQLAAVAGLMRRFEGWVDEHRQSSDPWADFGEFLRAALADSIGAKHVRPFRLVADGTELEPLRRLDVLSPARRIAAHDGVFDTVIRQGAAHVNGDLSGAAHAPDDRTVDGERTAWCFPVQCGDQMLGAVAVGIMDRAVVSSKELRNTYEQLVSQFWRRFDQILEKERLGTIDPITSVLTREAFLRLGNQALRESHALEEPVAVVSISVTGLRKLTDEGRWEVADDVMRCVGEVLCRKVRMDDVLGRLDGSRFVWVLRRVDQGLAELVVRQLAKKIDDAVRRHNAAGQTVHVHCGGCVSAERGIQLRKLLVSALDAAQTARRSNKLVQFANPCLTPDGVPASREKGSA